jgi:hypothetical protein
MGSVVLAIVINCLLIYFCGRSVGSVGFGDPGNHSHKYMMKIVIEVAIYLFIVSMIVYLIY